ncbi:paxU protein [Penicillium brasilianum]|uniref:PaxU protein n=1 Tax=Penicillium brasilianum TaxID=104259 RepID=A0A1S9RYW3_PENBI|nr:paxU protein [Penicillium brasilianum]
MPPKPVPFPGFTPLSDRIYLRNGNPNTNPPPPNHPTTIIIFGWGDGMPKHVSKYADGFHDLYPSTRILVAISKTLHASNQPLPDRIQAMMPIIDTVFPTPTGDGGAPERVLLHAMSNTGGIFVAAAMAAYQERHGKDKTLPHELLVCDSTPGGLVFSAQVGRWSRAMAVGTAKFFPWPFIVTQALWWVFLWANYLFEKMRGSEPSGVWANRVMNEENVTSRAASRLYLYSKEDEIIGFEDLEENVAGVKMLGYRAVDLELFEGSPHVGHMRLHPEQYWNRISGCWEAAVAAQ